MEKLIEKLQKLGLSRRESELYLTLLKKKEFTAPEIGKITSVSRNKSYEILQNLVKKRLCTEKQKNGMKVFSAVRPELALKNIISIYEEELDEKKKLSEEFNDELMKLYAGNEEVNGSIDYVEVLTDKGEIKERWLAIQENTKKELLVFTKPPYTGVLEDNIQTEEEVMKNKILIKGIYEYKHVSSAEEKKKFIEIVESYMRLGEEAKIIYELPMKLVISDETITMFALNDRISLKPSITTMLVDHPDYASAMKRVFDTYWASSMTIEDFTKLELFREDELIQL